MLHRLLIAALLAARCDGRAFAVSRALSSSMVLQREPARARLWGVGVPGDLVSCHGQHLRVDAQGRWALWLPPQPAGLAFGSGNVTVSSQRSGNLTLTGVLFGETWLCTGQSNMGLPLSAVGAGNDGHEQLVSWSGAVSWGEEELNLTSNYPLIRVTRQRTPTANLSCSPYHGRQRCSRSTPMFDAAAGDWQQPTRANMPGFSAALG